ncbi:hypothetical protein SCHPADRAFT_931505 [Schizopora paradoxa]|uniref:Arrestin-like N-terminal domain-containing protein n=1 Tax=Schizopora paradoxa TaxID=27342 RepID=A0A0H2RHH2_9AGAM|nr:hypothetical protein SCHPADRAFT_931505 [Schizopora paradoxa]
MLSLSKEEEAERDRAAVVAAEEHELPAYGDHHGTHAVAAPPLQPPPFTAASSSSAASRTEHTYSLNNSKGKPWLTLVIKSRAPSSKALPVFYEGDVISGTVSVSLDKPESSKGVTIAVTADNTAVGQEPIPFLDVSSQLWTPTSSSKLSGSESWPFSLTLPSETSVGESAKAPQKVYPLPPTFTERASPAYIDYKLTITVKRGAFKVNQTLGTSFLYIPRWRAPTPSGLRQLAYIEGTTLVGPSGDPGGWKVLQPVKLSGTIPGPKSVDLEYTLAVASPLIFATGSPIPLHLTISSNDAQALEILSEQNSPLVVLTRVIAIGSDATDDDAPRRSNNTFSEQQMRAYWWPSEEEAAGGKKVLKGEIDVRKATKPSFKFPRFTVRYQLDLMCPTALQGDAPSNQPILSERIQIVTENAEGIVPHSHAPPGYVVPDGEGNYNNSVGYLENGNQRFYHHHPGF